MSDYKHTQLGVVILVAMGCAVGGGVVSIVFFQAPAISWLVIGILILSLILFRSLTVAIAEGRLSWSFGPGLIHKSVNIADIETIEPFRIHWIAGWGIHWTTRGWLYNVSGWDAVWVRLKNGKQFCLGTDEPENLVQAVRLAVARQRGGES